MCCCSGALSAEADFDSALSALPLVSLPRGRHTFPFKLQIPSDALPNSDGGDGVTALISNPAHDDPASYTLQAWLSPGEGEGAAESEVAFSQIFVDQTASPVR